MSDSVSGSLLQPEQLHILQNDTNGISESNRQTGINRLTRAGLFRTALLS